MYMSLAPNLDFYADLDIKSRWNHPASNLIERNGQAMPGGFVPFQAGKHRILRIRPWPKVNGKTFAIWRRWIKPLRWGPCCSFGNLLLVGLSAVCLYRNATYLSNLVSKKTASLLMYYTHSHTFSKDVCHVLPWSSTCSFVVWLTWWQAQNHHHRGCAFASDVWPLQHHFQLDLKDPDRKQTSSSD